MFSLLIILIGQRPTGMELIKLAQRWCMMENSRDGKTISTKTVCTRETRVDKYWKLQVKLLRVNGKWEREQSIRGLSSLVRIVKIIANSLLKDIGQSAN